MLWISIVLHEFIPMRSSSCIFSHLKTTGSVLLSSDSPSGVSGHFAGFNINFHGRMRPGCFISIYPLECILLVLPEVKHACNACSLSYKLTSLLGKTWWVIVVGLWLILLTLYLTASQKNSREVQPLLGCGQPEQAGCRSFLYGSPDLSSNCNPRLLYYPTFHDGVRLYKYFCVVETSNWIAFHSYSNACACLLESV